MSERDIAVTQKKITAVYMRGGTSKGLFFRPDALPSDPGIRDQVLLRAIGSPDPYGRQIEGMGAATSSTSKVVMSARRPGKATMWTIGSDKSRSTNRLLIGPEIAEI